MTSVHTYLISQIRSSSSVPLVAVLKSLGSWLHVGMRRVVEKTESWLSDSCLREDTYHSSEVREERGV